MTSFGVAMTIALIFLYLVLASLYESFITPVTIMIAIPPAISGGIYAIFITGKMLDMMGVIGLIALVGLVTKNSILLVDFAVKSMKSGLSRKEAILEAGKLRLRPILMTTFAMIAGMMPLALGIGEAAQMRQAMGITIIGGLIISTLVTLVVVPAVFEYVDRFREFVERRFRMKEDAEASVLVAANPDGGAVTFAMDDAYDGAPEPESIHLQSTNRRKKIDKRRHG